MLHRQAFNDWVEEKWFAVHGLIITGILFLCLMAVSPVKADSTAVVVVYIDSDYSIQLYRQSTGEKTVVVPPDEASQGGMYLSPTGEHLAVQTQNGLAIFTLSPVRRILTRDLYPEPYHPVDAEKNPGAVQDDFYASAGLSGAWSPDGSRFAWTEGTPGTGEGDDFHNGDGTVGIFSALDGSVSIMPNEPGMPYGLNWSPDGSYLLYTGISHFGTGAGPTYSGIFLVDADHQNQSVKFASDERDIIFVGWVSNREFVYSSYDPAAGLQAGVFLYDLPTAIIKELIPTDQYNLEFLGVDEDSKTIIVNVGDSYSSNVDHSRLLPMGVYTLKPPYQEAQPLANLENFRIQRLIAPDFALGSEGVLRLSDATITIP